VSSDWVQVKYITKWKHWEILELNIQEDHIHLVLLATPRDSVSYIMQILKGDLTPATGQLKTGVLPLV